MNTFGCWNKAESLNVNLRTERKLRPRKTKKALGRLLLRWNMSSAVYLEDDDNDDFDNLS
jgi:hypothetical protein